MDRSVNRNAALFGVININKPEGITSRDVVNRVQKLVRPEKCGHAGTLDPMATGVLLVCVGPATRLISYLQDTTKVYEADFLLGQTSNTDDITGEVASVQLKASPPARKSVQAALDQMTGSIAQVPPSFSAVHVNGRRAYDLARRGEAVELVAREVQIDSIEIIRYEWPQLTVKVSCGSGTYIRSIARDLGEALGCGGLMSRLVRTRVGRFSIT
ncbi:MAG: tRNA pseudouridine(55) synthase TruB, partial [Planctomycetaceae bacterium]|nr:tRNA pseudouridine(55) synthase TruB [Planctomycetaceae bacterium]